MTAMRRVVVAAGVAAIAFTTFHLPTILTGRVLVSDAPTPPGWTGVVGESPDAQ